MEEDEFSSFYRDLYKKELTEPENEQDVRDILSCIRVQHGVVDDDDEAELGPLSATSRRKWLSIARSSRKHLARLTTIVSSQLYDDPFRFFYELIQNADDAQYPAEELAPFVSFRLDSERLVVELNEVGFSLRDVLSICDTGASSKADDTETTGEKGFGFKAVFGVADKVHIESGIWSFRFEHKQGQDGLGMVAPIWESREGINTDFKTRITLHLSDTSEDAMKKLCEYFEDQSATILYALRKLTKIRIKLDHVLGRSKEHTFEYLPQNENGKMVIVSDISGSRQIHAFYTWYSSISGLPSSQLRKSSHSVVKMAFPVKSLSDPEPLVCPKGQHIFAFLPVMRMSQLPFLIHADFILTASRQSVSDNPWNQKLRLGITQLFAKAVEQLVHNGVPQLTYTWMRLLPTKPIDGFWSTLLDLILAELCDRRVFLSYGDSKRRADAVRLVPDGFLHNGSPMLEAIPPTANFNFLSRDYAMTDHKNLKRLGVDTLSPREMIDLIRFDIKGDRSRLKATPFASDWHDAFLKLVDMLLTKKSNPIFGSSICKQVRDLEIMPIMNGDALEWWAMSSTKPFYFASIVEEGNGPDAVSIQIPSDVGLARIHIDASSSSQRKRFYQRFGAQDCAPERVCTAILAHQGASRSRWADDILRYSELLFWFSHPMDFSARSSLLADKMDKSWGKATGLFFQSDKEYDAARLICPRKKTEHQRYFLIDAYNHSSVSSRIRGGFTWEGWLRQVVGIRWHPRLENDKNHDLLHPLVNVILEENPHQFIPMLQAHWAADYSNCCRSYPKIKKALQKSLVLCQNGQRSQLQRTWFPSPAVLQQVRLYGTDQQISLLELPGSNEDHDIAAWPCLKDLGVSASPQISLYKEILSALADKQDAETDVLRVESLYNIIGQQASMDRKKELLVSFARITAKKTNLVQEYFSMSDLIFQPDYGWRSLSDCIWNSPVPLATRFVITTAYDAGRVTSLFRTLLGSADATASNLIEELLHIQKNAGSETAVRLSESIISLYNNLDDMATTPEIVKDILCQFRTHKLIFYEGTWLSPENCVWHTTAVFGKRLPIASLYPELKSFFVRALRVETVTETFMVRELARLALKRDKDIGELRQHMLATAALLTSETDSNQFSADIKTLQEAKILPCVSPGGKISLVATTDTFLIMDNDNISKQFQGKLKMLDFTYEDFNTLHPLFRLLDIEHRYFSKSMRIETEEGESEMHAVLTEQFQECAYALSCCAVLRRSPLYADKAYSIHDALRNAVVYVSSSMRTVLAVEQNGHEVKVDSDKVPLVMLRQDHGFRLVLPRNELERRQCFRNRLPTVIFEQLRMQDPVAQKQIYRILNEIDLGTDEIMAEEDIPPAPWLQKTARLQPPRIEPIASSTIDVNDGTAELSQGMASLTLERTQTDVELVIARSTSAYPISRPRHQYIHIPTHISIQKEPPGYSKVLEHVRRQARSVIWRNDDRERTLTSTSDLTRYFENLVIDGNDLELESRPELFGSDNLDKFRLGAAGELFVFEVLRSIPDLEFNFENWQSKIRHLIRAHQQVAEYRNMTTWTGRETADITYTDSNLKLWDYLQRRHLGDRFTLPTDEPWWPDWMNDQDSEGVEWFFEVKATTGPCETDFFMSTGQYDRMRSLGSANDDDRRQVYCLVRVYNLLTDRIGVRFYIDPWRFRENALEFGTTEKWKVKTTSHEVMAI